EGSAERRHYVDRLHSVEPFATFSLTNSLAGFLAPWLVMAICLCLAVWTSGKKNIPAVAALLAALAIITFCLLLTKSRTGWIASAAGVGLALLYTRAGGWRPGWKVPLAIAAALALLFLVAIAAG